MRLCNGLNGTGHWCKYGENHWDQHEDCMCNCGVTGKFLREGGISRHG